MPRDPIRRARPADAAAIGAVHVAAWRSAYPGILPDDYLRRLSVPRQAAYYDRAIRAGDRACMSPPPRGSSSARRAARPRIVGFATGGPARAAPPQPRSAEGEIETLYVLDDWRERGHRPPADARRGRASGGAGCRSAFLWVLRDNPSRWFYQRLGGRPVAEATIQVGGAPVAQTAYVWDPIEKLVQATSAAPYAVPQP